MSEDTYPEELYVAEIEILDYDDAYYWDELGLPDPTEWEGDYYEQHESIGDEYDDEDGDDDDSDDDSDWWER